MSFKSLLVFNNHGGSNEREAVTDGSAIVILVIEWTNLYTYVCLLVTGMKRVIPREFMKMYALFVLVVAAI